MLLNFLSNAVKHNVPGGRIGVECRAGADASRLQVRVCDTGRGLTAEQQGRLFTPFDRLGAETGPIGGTGLGLSLSKALVEAMGGTIGIESGPGKGSVFWLELPLTTAPVGQMAAGEGESVALPAATSGKTLTLLCIEDIFSNLTLIQNLLRKRPKVNLLSAICRAASAWNWRGNTDPTSSCSTFTCRT